jgi:hypothetical protein
LLLAVGCIRRWHLDVACTCSQLLLAVAAWGWLLLAVGRCWQLLLAVGCSRCCQLVVARSCCVLFVAASKWLMLAVA